MTAANVPSSHRGRRPVALVTGASSGVGDLVVRGLLDRGYDVWAAARRTERMAELERLGARVAPLDLVDGASIDALAERVLTESGAVDVLVNNAGYGSYGAVENVALDEARRQFEVNLFGLSALTAALLPAMRERRRGRIVNISSIAGTVWEPMAAWYHASKAALDRWSDCLRVEVRPYGVEVVTVRPSGFRTEWNTIARDYLRETSRGTAYERQGRGAARLIGLFGDPLTSSPAHVVADAILEAATSPRAARVVPAARGARTLMALVTVLPTAVVDEVLIRGTKALSKLPEKRR